MMVAEAPTATPVEELLKEIPPSSKLVPLVCVVQVDPPLVVS